MFQDINLNPAESQIIHFCSLSAENRLSPQQLLALMNVTHLTGESTFGSTIPRHVGGRDRGVNVYLDGQLKG